MAANEEREKPKEVKEEDDHRAGIVFGSKPIDQLLDGSARHSVTRPGCAREVYDIMYIVLQLAPDAPQIVQSLVLLEPALPVSMLGPDRMLSTQAAMAPVFATYRAGDRARAVDGFMRGVSGAGYRAVLDRVLPGAFEQGVADADTFFGQELPSLQQWSLKREDAGRITQPALSVVGAKSKELSPIWSECHEMQLTWLPEAEGVILPDATHLLHVEHPRAVAEALAAFFARHPFKAP